MFGRKDKDKDKKKTEEKEEGIVGAVVGAITSSTMTSTTSSGENEQIDASFAALLPELGIPAPKQQEMLKWDVEKKRQLLSIHGDKVSLFFFLLFLLVTPTKQNKTMTN